MYFSYPRYVIFILIPRGRLLDLGVFLRLRRGVGFRYKIRHRSRQTFILDNWATEITLNEYVSHSNNFSILTIRPEDRLLFDRCLFSFVLISTEA